MSGLNTDKSSTIMQKGENQQCRIMSINLQNDRRLLQNNAHKIVIYFD